MVLLTPSCQVSLPKKFLSGFSRVGAPPVPGSNPYWLCRMFRTESTLAWEMPVVGSLRSCPLKGDFRDCRSAAAKKCSLSRMIGPRWWPRTASR